MAHKITFDVKKWSYQDYMDFMIALRDGNWAVAMPMVMRILVAWDYDVPLSPTAYKKLPYPALPEIAHTVSDSLEAFLNGLDLDAVEVDLGRWTMDDFLSYQQAARDRNIPRLEALLRQVGVNIDVRSDRLSFLDGALLSVAVSRAIKESFGAGN